MIREEYNNLSRTDQKKAMRIAVGAANFFGINGCKCSKQVDECVCRLNECDSLQRDAFTKSLGVGNHTNKEGLEEWFLVFDDYVDAFISDNVEVSDVEGVVDIDILDLDTL